MTISLVISVTILILILTIIYVQKPSLFYTTNDYPKLKIIEDNFQIISSEIPEFDPVNNSYPRRDNSWPSNLDKKRFEEYLQTQVTSTWLQGWQGDCIWYNFPLIYNDQVIDRAGEICPKTIEILNKISGKTIVGFALLTPGSSLYKHRDPTGKKFGSMAANMLLTDNKNANLYVSDQVYTHSLGKMVIFDSTELHSADNNDNTLRTILYIDFKT